MKIIVTGCKGQLGTEIIKQLREGRSEIGPIPEKLMNATVIPVDLPELDISNYKMVDDFIRRQRPDVIINCAAYTNVDGCEVNHDAAFKANALGPRNLAQAAEKTGARLVHVSTDYVFSGRENGGIAQDEATIPGPISAYGSTKLMGEKYVEPVSYTHLDVYKRQSRGRAQQSALYCTVQPATAEMIAGYEKELDLLRDRMERAERTCNEEAALIERLRSCLLYTSRCV